ncbi:hypothetical protein [Roseomonas harenae]|uniref:hypothetical protein n=1 Tax=Muricoccus harenae TaxID=2692566 RepID=UPI0013316872|nr:hypothetical protein [Roseomonas harenae]
MSCRAPRQNLLTTHSRRRSAQRAIPHHAIGLLLDYGTSVRVRGADSYFFDKAARRRLVEALGPMRVKDCERFLSTFAIVGDDGRVVTVAHRTRRLRRA